MYFVTLMLTLIIYSEKFWANYEFLVLPLMVSFLWGFFVFEEKERPILCSFSLICNAFALQVPLSITRKGVSRIRKCCV